MAAPRNQNKSEDTASDNQPSDDAVEQLEAKAKAEAELQQLRDEIDALREVRKAEANAAREANRGPKHLTRAYDGDGNVVEA